MHQAIEIANKYKEVKGNFLFDLIDRIPKDKFKERALIGSKNALINKQLKKLAKLIDSTIKLSFHTSRHSFADYCKNKKLDISTIKDLLGHSKISTTEIYMKSFYEEETDKAMDLLFGK